MCEFRKNVRSVSIAVECLLDLGVQNATGKLERTVPKVFQLCVIKPRNRSMERVGDQNSLQKIHYG
jgi:hypothetical protein